MKSPESLTRLFAVLKLPRQTGVDELHVSTIQVE